MADISDVTAVLKGMVLAAVYPNGISQPSIAGYGISVPPQVASGGTGYAAGDLLYLATGITLQVAAASPSGSIGAVALVNPGISLSSANPVAVSSTSGAGTGATFTVAWSQIDVAVFEGWPQPNSLDGTLQSGNAMVAIYPPPGASTQVFQVLDKVYVITPPVHGLTATVAAVVGGAAVTLFGTPGPGEYASIIVGRQYAFSATGPSANYILNQIATQAATAFPAAVVAGNTITFPTTQIICNIGAPAVEGWATHRQRDPVWIMIFSPNNPMRNTLASTINMALSAVNHLIFPDTSQGVLVPSYTVQLDAKETVNIYRRDLCYTVEYATIQEFPAWQVTSFNLTTSAAPGESILTVVG